MIEFKIVEKQPEKSLNLFEDISPEQFNELNNNWSISINGEKLNLLKDIYGQNLKSSRQLQKENCKIVIDVYKKTIRLIKKIYSKKNVFIDKVFIVLDEGKSAQNNNLFMLEKMLNIKFFRKDSKFNESLETACDYIDNEITRKNMCDFIDNVCISLRTRNIKNRTTGCCPSTCPNFKNGKCATKNISCKYHFCKELKENGKFVFPLYIPVLKANFNIFQLFSSYGCHFHTTKKVQQQIGCYSLVLYLLFGAIVFSAILFLIKLF